MTQASQQQTRAAQARYQPNIYTLLLIVAILVLGATVGVVIWNLTANYGLEFADLFTPLLGTPSK